MKSKSTLKELEAAERALRKIALNINFGEDSFEHSKFHDGILKGLEIACDELALRRLGKRARFSWMLDGMAYQKKGWGPWRWVDDNLCTSGANMSRVEYFYYAKTISVTDGVVEICVTKHREKTKIKKIAASALIDLLIKQKNCKDYSGEIIRYFRIKE